MKTVNYLKSLSSVRERAQIILNHPKHLRHFTIHQEKLSDVINVVLELIKRDYPTPSDVPAHSRWRHFEAPSIAGASKVDRIGSLLKEWDHLETTSESGDDKDDTFTERKRKRTESKNTDYPTQSPSKKSEKSKSIHSEKALEQIRKLLDLFVVSVLLDAGAGNSWKYHPQNTPENHIMSRSEGLAIASYDWFICGGLSSSKSNKHRVDSKRLKSINVDDVKKAFQVNNSSNPLVGVEGRCELLNRLGKVLEEKKEYFVRNNIARPGFMLDYLLDHTDTTTTNDDQISVSINSLWSVVMDGLSNVWPATRTKLGDVCMGDVWPCEAMSSIAKDLRLKKNRMITDYDESADNLVPFHKLSQWLTYSLMEPLSLLNITVLDSHLMTGLPEYRNGGLLVDYGVLELKDESISQKDKDGIPTYQVYDDVVIEWRALTVALLDKVGEGVREKLEMSIDELPLVKVLEAGTWKAGREVATKRRPITKGPPINIISDGTVF